jgi:hypothetical protein
MGASANMKFAPVHLGDESDPKAPVAALLELPPGGVLPEHAHDCWRFEVVIKGSWIDTDGGVILPGDVRISKPYEFYGPFTAGPDGSLSLEIFSSADRDTIWPEVQDAQSVQLRNSVEAVAASHGRKFGLSSTPVGE